LREQRLFSSEARRVHGDLSDRQEGMFRKIVDVLISGLLLIRSQAMDYADWIRDRYERGVPIERIAEAALTGPVMLPGGAARVAALLQNVAAEMQVALSDVHIVGSARYGFSLRDGAAFDPAFSDLDLAVVDAGLHARCVMATNVSPRAARFPEKDLPVGGRIAVRRVFDDLSRSVADQFAYVSVAVSRTCARSLRRRPGGSVSSSASARWMQLHRP